MATPFRINSKQLFLTYAECPITREDCLSQLSAKLEPIIVLEYIVASELHANGHPHLHVYLKLQRPIDTRNSRFVDLLGPNVDGQRAVFHGNYQGCKSAKNVIKYVTKADNYISNLDVGVLLGKRSARQPIAEELIQKKRHLVDMVQEHPILLFGYAKLKLDLLTYQEDSKPEPLQLPTFLPNSWHHLLPVHPQTVKKRMYWIWSSKPNRGKTTWARQMREQFGAKILAGDFTYFDVSRLDRFLILDDYNAAMLKYHSLNQICDNTYSFRVFQRGSLSLNDYIVVVLSNSPIQEIYTHKYELLHARFTEINID